MFRRFGRRSLRTGFTLVEVVMVALVIAIIATLALTPSDGQSGSQAFAAGRRVTAMMVYGQNLAIARSDQSYALKIDPVTGVICLTNESAGGAVVINPLTREALQIRLGPAANAEFPLVSISGSNLGADNKAFFLSSGMLDQVEPALIEFAAGGGKRTVLSAPETGWFEVVEGNMTKARNEKGIAASAAGSGNASDNGKDKGNAGAK